jgi:uncharacterized protein (DUF4415 family)
VTAARREKSSQIESAVLQRARQHWWFLFLLQYKKMKKQKPLIGRDGEVRELEIEDFRAMRPAREAMNPELYANLVEESQKRRRGQRGPGKKPRKIPVSFRLDPDVAAAVKASGTGYSLRVNDTLRRMFVPRASGTGKRAVPNSKAASSPPVGKAARRRG